MAPQSLLLSLLALSSTTLLVSARTNLAGCTSTATTNEFGHASLLWYVPGTGEVCELLDCGGGRAPPKTTVPGCPAYEGTATVTPSYINLSTSRPAPRTTSAAGGGDDGNDSSDPVITSAPTAEWTTVPNTSIDAPTDAPAPTGAGEGGDGEGVGPEESATTGAPAPTPLADAAAGLGVAGSVMAGIVAVAGLVLV